MMSCFGGSVFSHTIWIVIYILFHHVLLAQGFQSKTKCLVDYIPTEEELEGEGREWAGGARPGASWAGIAAYPNGAYGEADEFEMDEFEGQGHYGGQQQHGWPGAVQDQGYDMGFMDTNNTLSPWGRRGYVDADGEWEDARKKRRRRRRRRARSVRAMGTSRSRRQVGMAWGRQSQHTPAYLRGQLSCDSESTIHILKVTLGYTVSPSCDQGMYYGCQGSSSKATQVLNCQGIMGSCDVTIARYFLSRCGKRVNFALITYECIPVSRRVDICSGYDSDVSGGVVISSPSYPLVATSSSDTGVTDNVVTCECTIRAPADSRIQMNYLRSILPGHHGACDGDLLLLEKPDQSNDGRYVVVSEICGTNYTTSPLDINDSILRITFLGGAPVQQQRGGFIGKFTARSRDGLSSLFHLSCEPPPGIDNGGSTSNGRLVDNNGGSASQSRNGDGQPESAKTKPGVLSGVVASLAAVIVIMGSIGTLLIYRRLRRRQMQRQEREERNRRRRPSISSVESDDVVSRHSQSNTGQFFSRPRQIVRSAPASSSSAVAPPYPAPPPPPPGPPPTIYSIAGSVPSEASGSSPKLADMSSLPDINSDPNNLVAPPRRKKDRSGSAVSETPYDNATSKKRPEREITRNKTGRGDGKTESEEPHKYEEPRRMSRQSVDVDVHAMARRYSNDEDDDISEVDDNDHEVAGNDDPEKEYYDYGGTDDEGSKRDDVGYSSIDEMQQGVVAAQEINGEIHV